jgi:hypothetical protein
MEMRRKLNYAFYRPGIGDNDCCLARASLMVSHGIQDVE